MVADNDRPMPFRKERNVQPDGCSSPSITAQFFLVCKVCYNRFMTKRERRKVILTTFADFFTGMATAWAFAAIDSLNHLIWLDLLSSLWLAILTFSAAISIKSTLYVEYT